VVQGVDRVGLRGGMSGLREIRDREERYRVRTCSLYSFSLVLSLLLLASCLFVLFVPRRGEGAASLHPPVVELLFLFCWF